MTLLTSLLVFLTTFLGLVLYVVRRLLMPVVPVKGTTNIPGPTEGRRWPIVGDALWFWGVKNSSDVYGTILRLSYMREKLMSFYLGQRLVIVVMDAGILETIISTNKCQAKEFYRSFNSFSNGVFTKNGKGWSVMRRPLDRLLHPKHMDDFHRVFTNKAKTLCSQVGDKCGKGVFDMKHLMEYCMLDITLEKDLHAFSTARERENVCLSLLTPRRQGELRRDSKKQTLLKIPGTQQIEDTMNIPEVVKKIVDLVFKKIVKIEYNIDWIYHLSSLGRLDLMLKGEIRPALKKMVDNCFKNLESTGRDPADHDFVPENFIEVAIQTGICEHKTEEELVFSFLDLIMAGFDTTSVAISSTLLFLAMHPEYQEKAYHEQMEVMRDSFEAPSRKQLSRMNYLDMTFNETLRHVSAPAVARKISAQFTIDGYIFPEGASLYIMFHHLFKNPKYWERPADFYPDHFLPEEVATRPKGAFLPFSFGGRACPGKLVGIQSSKLILSMLLRRYKFTTSLKYEEMVYKYMLMVESEKGYPLEVTARANLTDTA